MALTEQKLPHRCLIKQKNEHEHELSYSRLEASTVWLAGGSAGYSLSSILDRAVPGYLATSLGRSRCTVRAVMTVALPLLRRTLS